MSLVPGLSLSYLPPAVLDRQPPQWWDEVLGISVFGEQRSRSPSWPQSVPAVHVMTPELAGGAAVCEVWRAAAPLVSGSRGALRYRCNESMIFGCAMLDERDFAAASGGDPDSESALRRVTGSVYRQLFALLDETGYPGLFRVWNYFPGINAEVDGSERYWQFNAGRQEAFVASGRATRGSVPAACALGVADGPFVLYFLALREAPQAIENPRQISAYDYPDRYGPRSPTFARASLAQAGAAPVLFVSGTASIVGHRTLHPDDVVAQTAESFRNIDAVLAEALTVAPETAWRLDDLAYKVYVRNAADFEAVRAAFGQHVAGEVPVLFLQADVCRADLLVEIEASGGHAVEMK
jgi:enamine deaminase RidA (YjgF/YER057c/UK114 family)